MPRSTRFYFLSFLLLTQSLNANISFGQAAPAPDRSLPEAALAATGEFFYNVYNDALPHAEGPGVLLQVPAAAVLSAVAGVAMGRRVDQNVRLREHLAVRIEAIQTVLAEARTSQELARVESLRASLAVHQDALLRLTAELNDLSAHLSPDARSYLALQALDDLERFELEHRMHINVGPDLEATRERIARLQTELRDAIDERDLARLRNHASIVNRENLSAAEAARLSAPDRQMRRNRLMAIFYSGAVIDSLSRLPIFGSTGRDPGISPSVNLTYSFGKHVLSGVANGAGTLLDDISGNSGH